MIYNNVFVGKKVLITGNTGFKGSWLSTWLLACGAEVYGYSINIPTNPSMFEVLGLNDKIHHYVGNVCEKERFFDYVSSIKPDFIFHLAAQPLVSVSYSEPFETITTNVIGTASVLEAVKRLVDPCVVILITSDKAYDNVEWIWGYRENDPLGGKDVYSGSKGAAELVIKSYWHSFIKDLSHIKLGVARAGNVIGGGDWSADRIIVDSVKAFHQNQPLELRCPQSTRPWQHVLEPLSGYLCLAQNLYEGKIPSGEAFNFGPNAEQLKTVLQLVKDIAFRWGVNGEQIITLKNQQVFEEARLLKLNCDKSLAYLQWHSVLSYDQTVKLIVDWYMAYYSYKNIDMYDLTLEQIEFYMSESRKQNLIWVN